jgi:hypothetical protein
LALSWIGAANKKTLNKASLATITRSEFGAGFWLQRAMRGGVAVSVMVRGFMRSMD